MVLGEDRYYLIKIKLIIGFWCFGYFWVLVIEELVDYGNRKLNECF